MSTPVTLSGFNNIDFGSILKALMAQARQPETVLQTQQHNLQIQSSNLSTLATKLSALDGAAAALASPTSLTGRSVTNTNSTAVAVVAGTTTPLGTYDIKVQQLAHAQVTESTTTAPDSDTTIVASGGTLTIGGVDVALTGDTTLQGLADAINATADVPVSASVVRSSATTYSLVLTGNSTGSANSFTIANTLTGGTGVAFGANAVDASDAAITVNNVAVTSDTNTFVNAVPGATIQAFKADPATTVSVTVNQSTADAKASISAFVTAYNDLVAFTKDQSDAANKNDATSIGHDTTLRSVNIALQQVLGGVNTADSVFQSLASIGVSFTTTGELAFNAADFDAAVSTGGLSHVQALLSGAGGVSGVFQSVHDQISEFTGADGFVTVAKQADADRIESITSQIAALEERLKVQEASLQQQFAAADRAISTLNSQATSLGSLANQYNLF